MGAVGDESGERLARRLVLALGPVAQGNEAPRVEEDLSQVP